MIGGYFHKVGILVSGLEVFYRLGFPCIPDWYVCADSVELHSADAGFILFSGLRAKEHHVYGLDFVHTLRF